MTGLSSIVGFSTKLRIAASTNNDYEKKNEWHEACHTKPHLRWTVNPDVPDPELNPPFSQGQTAHVCLLQWLKSSCCTRAFHVSDRRMQQLATAIKHALAT